MLSHTPTSKPLSISHWNVTAFGYRRASNDDPASAAAEYGAEFRTDVENFITIEAVRACIEPGIRERPPLRQWRYTAFVDPSGGSADSMTLGIAHKEADTAILDLLREVKPPFSPESVVEDFAATLKKYRLTKVFGDRYAGEWVREPFRRHGINYDLSEKAKSDLYRDLLPIVNSGGVDLLDNDRLVNQLVQLERRTARGGRDSIDHPPGAHDDVANAAGALTHVAKRTAREPGTTHNIVHQGWPARCIPEADAAQLPTGGHYRGFQGCRD